MTHLRTIPQPELADIIPLTDQPSPMLQWVAIADMVIDERYQRPINRAGQTTIRKIAQNFSWACFAPVLLAPVEGGKFAVIDGQHRVHAAALCGIEKVPAQVVPIAATEQASAFLRVNTQRTAMSRYNKLAAGIAAGELWALDADRAVRAADCELMRFTPSNAHRKPGQILSVALVCELVSKGHGRAVTTTLKALRAIEDDQGPSAKILLYSDWLLNPLMKAVAGLQAHRNGLDAEMLADCLRKKRPFLTMDAAERAAKAEHKSIGAVARQMFEAAIGNHLKMKGAA